MSNDFDEFPLYDAMTDANTGKLTNVWVGSIATFYQTLITYLTQGGIFLPQLTTGQRDSLLSPQNGQMIYNTTLNTAQYFKAGTWTSF